MSPTPFLFSPVSLFFFFLQTTEDVSSQWTERQAGNWTAVYHSYTGRTSANCSRESGKSEKESAHQAGCVTEGPSSICSLLGAMGHYGSTDVSTRVKTGWVIWWETFGIGLFILCFSWLHGFMVHLENGNIIPDMQNFKLNVRLNAGTTFLSDCRTTVKYMSYFLKKRAEKEKGKAQTG